MGMTRNVLKLSLSLALVILANRAWAQLTEVWAANYTNGYARAATVDSNGNVYITGSSDNTLGTVKFDANGAVQWSASYSGRHSYGDGANAIALDGAGNVYVTGAATGNRFYYVNGTYKTYLTDSATVKYDSTGHQKWASSY